MEPNTVNLNNNVNNVTTPLSGVVTVNSNSNGLQNNPGVVLQENYNPTYVNQNVATTEGINNVDTQTFQNNVDNRVIQNNVDTQTFQNNVSPNNSQIQVNVEPIPDNTGVQNSSTTEVAEINSKSEPASKEPIKTDKYLVKVAKFKEMLNYATKIAVNNPVLPLTTVVHLSFNQTGLTVSACDAAEGNYIIQSDNTYEYIGEELSIGVASTLLRDLINKIDDRDDIELTFERESRILTVHADGEYKFPEIFDPNDGQSVRIDLPQMYTQINVQPYDNIALRRLINNALTTLPEQDSMRALCGIILDENIYSTNRLNMCIQKGLSVFTNTFTYITKLFATLITSVNLGDNPLMGLVKDANQRVSHVILKSDNITLAGPTMAAESLEAYPIPACKLIADSKFSQNVTVDKLKLYKALDKIKLFTSTLTEEYSLFTLTTQGLKINSLDGGSEVIVPVENCTDNLEPVNLKPKDFLPILNKLTTDKIIFSMDKTEKIFATLTDNISTYAISIDQRKS